jgi:hypothetical protein
MRHLKSGVTRKELFSVVKIVRHATSSSIVGVSDKVFEIVTEQNR